MVKFVGYIKELDNDFEQYKLRYEQPLLLEEPKLDDAIQFVRSIVK
jgi:hypothetical protein